MKFMLISPKNRTVYNFRGDLIKKISNLGYEIIVTGPDRTDIDKIEALGAKFYEVPVNKNGTSIISDIKYCKNLKRIMKEEKPDVILGYTIKPVIYGAIAAKKAKVKSINSMVTGAGFVFTSKSFKAKILSIIVKLLYKKGFKCSNNVIFQNKDDLEEFVNRKLVKKEKCNVVNGSGVNMDKFHKLSYPKETSFFMLSRLLKSKGVVEYLKAAELIKNKYPNTKFYLLGKYETAMQDAVNKEIIEKYIKDNVVERFEETSNVLPYYEKCSVYVLPSYREGVPRTVLEAMACGRPIITTDTNGCRETVVDGENGYLVPVKNIEKLCEAMEKFILDTSKIEIMGNNSYELCLNKFDVNIVNDKMVKIMNID